MSATKAHRFTYTGNYVPQWHGPKKADVENATSTATHRAHSWCSWCGSMHPTELAAAIKAGATLSAADRKYGWPHKFYVDGAPNPFAGEPEIISAEYGGESATPEMIAAGWKQYPDGFDQTTGKPVMRWARLGAPRPAPASTHGKFYTEHLQDATPEERAVIERAMGLRFEFDDAGGVRWGWGACEPRAAAGA